MEETWEHYSIRWQTGQTPTISDLLHEYESDTSNGLENLESLRLLFSINKCVHRANHFMVYIYGFWRTKVRFYSKIKKIEVATIIFGFYHFLHLVIFYIDIHLSIWFFDNMVTPDNWIIMTVSNIQLYTAVSIWHSLTHHTSGFLEMSTYVVIDLEIYLLLISWQVAVRISPTHD